MKNLFYLSSNKKVAVVIVFTVCQIPQAISLTVQSFFSTLSRTSKVLIYNNFANCLVALNASINFLLYCCFSDRFRSTFSSSFSCLSKYCFQDVEPKWKINKSQKKTCGSLETMAFQVDGQPSLRTRISNISYDLTHSTIKRSRQDTSSNQNQSCTTLISKLNSVADTNSHQRDFSRLNVETVGYPENKKSKSFAFFFVFQETLSPLFLRTSNDENRSESLDETIWIKNDSPNESTKLQNTKKLVDIRDASV